jgi:hypothetical protein
MVSFTPLSLCRRGKSPTHPLGKRLGGSQTRSEHGRREKYYAVGVTRYAFCVLGCDRVQVCRQELTLMNNESTKVHGVTRKDTSIHIHSREILISHSVTHYNLCHFDPEDGSNRSQKHLYVSTKLYGIISTTSTKISNLLR